MLRQKGDEEAKGRIWRISSAFPAGAYVDEIAPSAPVQPAYVRERGWLVSSFELLHGMDVSEAPMDTLPAELVEQFFKYRR